MTATTKSDTAGTSSATTTAAAANNTTTNETTTAIITTAQQQQYYEDALDDVHTRFILNLPDSELASNDRLFFQLEQAWWYYEDWICDVHPEYNLPRYTNLKLFAKMMFEYSPILPNVNTTQFHAMWYEFCNYRKSISNYGCILLSSDLQYMALCTIYNSKTHTFPSGKINHGESGMNAAARETYEETGFDPLCLRGLTSLWKENDPTKITWSTILSDDDMVVHQEESTSSTNTNTNPNSNNTNNNVTQVQGKRRIFYIVVGVPKDFPFAPVCRKEISDISWFPIHGPVPKPSFGVLPFIPQVKRYIRHYKQKRQLQQSDQQTSKKSTPKKNRSRNNSPMNANSTTVKTIKSRSRANSPTNPNTTTIISSGTTTIPSSTTTTMSPTTVTPSDVIMSNVNPTTLINSNSNSNHNKKGTTPGKNGSRTASPINNDSSGKGNNNNSSNTPARNKNLQQQQPSSSSNHAGRTSRGRNHRNNKNSRSRSGRARSNSSGTTEDLLETGLVSNMNDPTGWSEDEMFEVNEKLTGTKSNYDGNPYIFAEQGFVNGIDPHSYRIVGGTLLNQQQPTTSSSQQQPSSSNPNVDLNHHPPNNVTAGSGSSFLDSLIRPHEVVGIAALHQQQQPKLDHNNRKHRDDTDEGMVIHSSLQPFFSMDGSTPWGEIVKEVIHQAPPSLQTKEMDDDDDDEEYVVVPSLQVSEPSTFIENMNHNNNNKSNYNTSTTNRAKNITMAPTVTIEATTGSIKQQQQKLEQTNMKKNGNNNNKKSHEMKDEQQDIVRRQQHRNVDESWHQDGMPFLTDAEITTFRTLNDAIHHNVSTAALSSTSGQQSVHNDNSKVGAVVNDSFQQQQQQRWQKRREQHQMDLEFIQQWVANLPKQKVNTIFGSTTFRLDVDEMIRIAQESISTKTSTTK